jgi:hypothetical protein
MSRAKQNALFLLLAAGTLTLLLAMTLPGVKLSAGQPFSIALLLPTSRFGSTSLAGGDFIMLVFRGITGLLVLLLPVIILYSLFTPDGRQRLLVLVVLVVLLLVLADFLEKLPEAERIKEPTVTADAQPPYQEVEATLETLLSETPPPEFTLAVILVVSILLTAAGGAVVWFFWQRKPPDFAFEKLADEARNAVESINAGGDFEEAIMRCYSEMSRVLTAEKGIIRPTSMTPREFEERLGDRGLPQASLNTLTRLFEQARYSRIPAAPQEQNLALACLADIIEACKPEGDRHDP